jgi:hypothetical protein
MRRYLGHRIAEGSRRFPPPWHDRDGSYRWLSWTAVPNEGRLYAVARDVTELKNAEEQLRVSRHDWHK